MSPQVRKQFHLYLTITFLQTLQAQLILIIAGVLTFKSVPILMLFAVNLILPCLITAKAFLNQDISSALKRELDASLKESMNYVKGPSV